jgi:hypothetical protein
VLVVTIGFPSKRSGMVMVAAVAAMAISVRHIKTVTAWFCCK